MRRIAFLLVAAVAVLGSSPGRAAELSDAVDPLTVMIRAEDADRFAKLFKETGGRPTAQQLDRLYLQPGSYGVEVFTPGRIKNAEALAERVNRDPDLYRSAIERCLPIVKQANSELRAIYLGMRGLFPSRPLPQIYIVFGGGNSGGTAGPGAQVLGLEVLCKAASTPDKLRETLRMFFAHETVHTWQPKEAWSQADPLLRAILLEGAADYVASLVLGRAPSEERETWGSTREEELWRQLSADLEVTRGLSPEAVPTNGEAHAAVRRWVGNYSQPPEGWPPEMGYWMGKRIWQRYVEGAPDKRAALESVLTWTNPREILRRGPYRGR